MFSALINKQYNIVAKTVTPKMELEALADKMSKDQYVIFTKKPELVWDKDLALEDPYSNRILPYGFAAYTQKDLYNYELVEIDVKGEGRTGQMFGPGFYLASSASKAAQYNEIHKLYMTLISKYYEDKDIPDELRNASNELEKHLDWEKE